MILIMFVCVFMFFSSQRLRQTANSKIAALANLHAKVHRLEQEKDGLLTQVEKDRTLVIDLQTEGRAGGEELGRVEDERDAQKATVEQKTQEVERLGVALRERDEALAAEESEHQ